jgi:SAM-dependent methyltransferase
MLRQYFKTLYKDTMSRAYSTAYEHIAASITADSAILDCGANNGWTFRLLAERYRLRADQYSGIEWSEQSAAEGRGTGLDITAGDLNKGIQRESETYSCVYALSLLEHLLNPCRFLKECHRVIKPGGRLVLLTPNISTYFTAMLILAGKMPSSGPHPDSNELLEAEELFKVRADSAQVDTEGDTPGYRHIVVFSYRVLRQYLGMIGFNQIEGHGFGLYPFPRFTQPLLERIDPYHCHQMVFVATKAAA